MQKSKNQIAHEQAQKNLLIVVLMFAIIGLGGYSLFHVSDKLTEQSNQVAIGETKVVPVASYIKYRFRQIYGGGDVNSHLSNSTAVPQMAAPQHRSASAHDGAYVAPSAAAPSMNGGSGAGYTMHTTSSQSMQSYGGGTSAGGYGNVGGASASAAAPSVGYSGGGYASMPSLALAQKPTILVDEENSTDPNVIQRVDRGTNIGDAGAIPLGDTLFPLLLLALGYAILKFKKRRTTIV